MLFTQPGGQKVSQPLASGRDQWSVIASYGECIIKVLRTDGRAHYSEQHTRTPEAYTSHVM